MSYVLVLMLYWPGAQSTSMTNIPGFKSQKDCEVAGKTAKDGTSYPMVNFVCLKQ